MLYLLKKAQLAFSGNYRATEKCIKTMAKLLAMDLIEITLLV